MTYQFSYIWVLKHHSNSLLQSLRKLKESKIMVSGKILVILNLPQETFFNWCYQFQFSYFSTVLVQCIKMSVKSLVLFHSDCRVLIRLQTFMPRIFAVVLAIKETMFIQCLLSYSYTENKVNTAVRMTKTQRNITCLMFATGQQILRTVNSTLGRAAFISGPQAWPKAEEACLMSLNNCMMSALGCAKTKEL